MSEKVLITKEKLDDLANKVASKSGEEIPLTIEEMGTAVLNIKTEPILEDSITITPTKSTQVVAPEDGYDGLSEVVVNPIPNRYKIINNTDLYIYPQEYDQGYYATQEGYTGYSYVHITSIGSNYIGSNIPRKSSINVEISKPSLTFPSGYYSSAITMSAADLVSDTLNITSNSIYDVTNYSSVNVSVATHTAINIYQDENGYVVLGDDSAQVVRLASLNITENGIYSEPGVAYNSVNVNVVGQGYTIDDIATKNFESNIFGNASIISAYAFTHDSTLQTATFSECTSIGYYAFDNCFNLSSISFPKCTNIDGVAFSYCQNLVTADFPKCTLIGENAFANCGRLTTVNFPECLRIGSDAFYNCSKLSSISFPKCDSIWEDAFRSCSSLTAVSFPECTTIKSRAFYDCANLTTVDFPKCSSIGYYVFSNCYNLSSINLQECTNIGTAAFYSCSRLYSVDFPNCDNIGTSAFSYCTNLTTISFPSCTTIASYAFSGCGKLTSANFPKCSSLRGYTFAGCTSLSTVNFPECTEIGAYAFFGCHKLSSINFPVCSIIGTSAFASCYSLSSVSFSSCSYIYTSAFYSCSNLQNIYLLGDYVPSLQNSGAFSGTLLSTSGSIFVKASLYNSFITANNWSIYSSRFVSLTDVEIEALGDN